MFKPKYEIKKLIHHSPSEQTKQLPCYIHAMGWRVYSGAFGNKRNQGELFDYQLQYVVRGKGRLVWHDIVYEMGPGDLFFIDLSQAHHYYADEADPWEAIWIHFGGQQAEHYYRLFGNSQPVPVAMQQEKTEDAFHRLLSGYDRQSVTYDLYAAVQLIALLTDLIAAKWNRSSTEPDSSTLGQTEISLAMAFMEQDHRHHLTVADIAKHVSFSPYHFSRIFKRITGYTVQEYLAKYRVTKVKDLLAHTDLPLSEIAVQTGFCDQSHMGKVFKRIEHMTPKQYQHHMAPSLK